MVIGEHSGGWKDGLRDFWNTWQAYFRRDHVLRRAKRGDFDPLLAAADLALNFSVWHFGSDHRETGRKLAALAAIHGMRGEADTAIPLYRRAISVLGTSQSTDDLDDCVVLREQLAALLHSTGRFADAEHEYESLVALHYSRHGDSHHTDTARTLDALAQTRKAQGHLSKAKAGHRDALLHWEAVCGPGSPEVARCLTHLASLYLSERRYDEAEPLLIRAVAEWKSSPNPHDLYAVITLSCCGDLYRSTGRGTEAQGVEAAAKAMLARYVK